MRFVSRGLGLLHFDSRIPEGDRWSKSAKRNEAPCRVPAGNPDGGRFAACEGMAPATRGPDGWQMADGSPLPDHAPKNIPPAWREVVVATDPDADLLVKGIDAKGRTQSVYSDNHTMRAAAAKFARVNELRAKQDEIDDEIARDLTSTDKATREAAAALRLIRATGLRPGGEGDTGAEKQAYGATTLEGRHVKTSGGNVRLQFTGKKGVDLDIPVLDKGVAADLKARKLAAGAKGKVFDTDAAALRDYTAGKDGGGFKPKDFRTAKGTSEAIAKIKKTPTPKDEKEYKKAVREVAKHVSEKLGNTPAIALQSYIDPTVFAVWRAKAMKKSVKAAEPCRIPAGQEGGGRFAPCDGGSGGNPVSTFISKATGIQFSPEGYPIDNKGVEAGTPGYDYKPVYEKVKAAQKVADAKIAERLKATTTAEEAEAFVRGYFTGRPELADANISKDGPHLAAASLVTGAWNYSSTAPVALALMQAAKEKFGIEGAANVQSSEFAAHSKVLGDLAGAIYAETQQQLKDAGVDKVTVYRGMSFQRETDWAQADGDNIAVQSNPLSSFSTNLYTAEGFTRDDNKSLAVILGGTVPRESIFSIPTSGVGCTTEHEVVVMHSDKSRFKARSHAMTYNYNPDTERSSFPRIYPTEESFWGSDAN